MSFFKSAFSFKKTKPRKFASRSPLKLSAEETSRELGRKCEVIDVKVADRKIFFDIENGNWDTANAENLGGINSTTSGHNIRKQVEILQQENNMLQVKVEVLLNRVAESIADLASTEQ